MEEFYDQAHYKSGWRPLMREDDTDAITTYKTARTDSSKPTKVEETPPENDSRDIRILLTELLTKLDAVSVRLNGLDTRIDALDGKIGALKTGFEAFQTKAAAADTATARLGTKIDELGIELESIYTALHGQEENYSSLLRQLKSGRIKRGLC